MKYRRFQKIVRAVTLAGLAFVLFTEPVMVAAKTLQKDPQAEALNTLVNGGDIYLGSASKAIVGSMELLGYLNTIQSTPLNQISETYVSEVIDRALGIAEQSSIALGSVDVMADGIEQLGGTFPAAMNVAEAAGAGIPQEMRDNLSALGIPSANIDQVSASASDLLSARQAGIPANVQADLLGFGFSQSQIDQIALAASQRGLANNGLTTKLDQFRATQDELADTRTGMVILAVQLLGYQIAARQVNGIAPRAVADDELQALAEDELRLLVHVAHLNAMWGSNPSTETGEGDWWFIEHYAGRAAERLQAMTVESQNRGLVAELFVLHQMKMLAVSARTGDAEYAQAELNGLAALLSYDLNATAYYQERQNPGLAEKIWARATATPALREKVEWSVPKGVAKNAKLIMQEQINSTSVENLALIIGGFDESNEANNVSGLLIVAGLSFFDQLEASVVQTAVQVISSATPENMTLWIKAILTGDTDNPALLAANVILSLIPVIGVLPDLVTLAVDPSIFVKALSIFGIIGSIGDIIALIPGLQGVGGASFVGDAVATVVKTLFKQADNVFRAVLNGLKLADAFDVVADLVKTVVRIVGNSLGDGLNAVIRTITNIFTGSRSLWGDFVSFVRRAGADMLLKLGFDEGSALVGRILNLGVDLSDEALVVVDNVGDKIVKAGVELSDEGSEGVGVLAKNLDPEDVTKFSDELLAICGVAGHAPGNFKLARPLFRANSDCVNRVSEIIGTLDNVAETGVNKLSKIFDGKELAQIASKYTNNPENIKGLFKIVGESNASWSRSAFKGLEKSAGSYGLDATKRFANDYGDDAVARAYNIFGESKVVWKQDGFEGLIKAADTLEDIHIQRIQNLKDIPGIDNVTQKFLNGTDATIRGTKFELELADEIGAGQIRELSVVVDKVPDADIILKSGKVVEAKAYIWRDSPTEEWLQDIFIKKDMDQIVRRLEIYGPDTRIEVIFQGSPPNYNTYPFALRLMEGYKDFAEAGFNVTARFHSP